MKKILLLMAAVILFSPLSYADDYGRHGHGWGHRDYEHHHRHHYQPEVRYYPQPPVVYYAQPEVRYYQQQPPPPPVRYYPQPPQYSGNSLHLSW